MSCGIAAAAEAVVVGPIVQPVVDVVDSDAAVAEHSLYEQNSASNHATERSCYIIQITIITIHRCGTSLHFLPLK